MKSQQEWKSRKEIPNRQIKDVADQYDTGRRILLDLPPGSGVVWPLLNASAVAIELYLKCLSAEVIHTPLEDDLGTHIVSAEAIANSHHLVSLFDAIPDEVRCNLTKAFEKSNDTCSKCFRDALGALKGVLEYSRYPYEPARHLEPDIPKIMWISAFLHEFVDSLEPREWIEWQ